jgi:trimeric autotransporter adhesin
MRKWLVLIFLYVIAGTAQADLLGSAVSVQGVLSVNGEPAGSVFDLRITPYPDAAIGAPLAPPLEIDNVFFVEGAFTTKVDFGVNLFLGDAIFFEIAVRPGNSSGAYEVLVPRQELTAAPYALKPAAGSVTDLEIANDAVRSAQVLDGSVRTAELADAAVTTVKLADASVATAKIADTAVSTAKLADAAVTLAKLGPDVVDSSKIVDGSVAAADLVPGLLNLPSWSLTGNAASAGQFLGTTNATPLPLRSDVGVTINGDNFNDSTELTIRGSPATPETNADLTLWPRGGTAFFNFAAIGNEPTTASMTVSSVVTSPFSGFVPRMVLTHGGALGIGGADPTPVGILHATRFDLGVDALDFSEAYDLIVEDVDAQANILSSNGGGAGSTLMLGEMNAGAYVNGWGLWRATGGITNVPLNFSYGSSSTAPTNPSRMMLYSDGSLFAGNVAPTSPPTTSFVFADGSSATPFNTSAANQFLLRASGGVGVNRTPSATSTELSVGPSAAGASVDVVLGSVSPTETNAAITLGTPGTDTSFRVQNGSSPSGNGFFTVYNRNSATTETPAFQIVTSGSSFSRSLALFRGRADGTSLLPNHPIHVGDSTITNSGNGAHLTTGGVWTNGSSRGFKEGFSRIDSGAILDRVLTLPVLQWRYKGEDASLHLGPIAEDFKAAFGLGGDERYIGTVDADGVALAAIQGLNRKLERENDELRASLEALVKRLDALERKRRGDDDAH